MKANIPVAWDRLPKSQRDAIIDWQKEEIEKNVTRIFHHDEAEIQKCWISYAAVILHQMFDFTEEQIMTFIIAWKRIYRKNKYMETKEEVQEYIKKELSFLRENFRGTSLTIWRMFEEWKIWLRKNAPFVAKSLFLHRFTFTKRTTESGFAVTLAI